MRAQFLVVIAIGLLSGGDPPKEDKGKADRDALKGTWNVVFQKPDALPRVVIEKLIFKGDKLTWHSSLQEQRSSVVTKIKLDPSTEPKEIDFTPTSGGAKGQTYLGIYEIKEDILKICYRGPGKARPGDFTTQDSALLISMERDLASKPDDDKKKK